MLVWFLERESFSLEPIWSEHWRPASSREPKEYKIGCIVRVGEVYNMTESTWDQIYYTLNKLVVRCVLCQAEGRVNWGWTRSATLPVTLTKVRLWEPGWEFGTSGWMNTHCRLWGWAACHSSGPPDSIKPTTTSSVRLLLGIKLDIMSIISVGKFGWRSHW